MLANFNGIYQYQEKLNNIISLFFAFLLFLLTQKSQPCPIEKSKKISIFHFITFQMELYSVYILSRLSYQYTKMKCC